MALIHPRVARNFIKNGYFPTDEPTLERISSALEPAVTGGALRALDPCCGEGAALWTLANHLQACGAEVNSYGVELDEERAWHAKTLLGTVAHADVHDVRISERSFGLLFLNPPRGRRARTFSTQPPGPRARPASQSSAAKAVFFIPSGA